jgi:hypothetical protein
MRRLCLFSAIVICVFLGAQLLRGLNAKYYAQHAQYIVLRDHPELSDRSKDFKVSVLNFLRGDIRIEVNTEDCGKLTWTVNVLMADIIPWHSSSIETECRIRNEKAPPKGAPSK